MQFLDAEEIISIHDSILETEAGLAGIRPDMSLETVLGRIFSHIQYGTVSTVFEVAALYGEAIARGHLFNDANKRTALMAMLTFLSINGYELSTGQHEIADLIVNVAEGQVDRPVLARWLESRARPTT